MRERDTDEKASTPSTFAVISESAVDMWRRGRVRVGDCEDEEEGYGQC